MKGVCLCTCFEACINYLFTKACEATTGTCRPDLPRERYIYIYILDDIGFLTAKSVLTGKTT